MEKEINFNLNWCSEVEFFRFNMLSYAWKFFFVNKQEFERLILEDKLFFGKLNYTVKFKITK